MKSLRFAFSLRSKIILLVSGAAFFTALLISVLSVYHTRRIAVESAVERLAGQTRLAAMKVKAAYVEMKSDAFVLSRTPPIQGLIDSMRNNGVDPRDGSTQAQWRARLNMIFASMIEARSNYTQIRFIGAAGNGLELVRVNRLEDGAIEVVKPDDMQRKFSEEYFQEGLKLRPGQFYYSKVTYNREWDRLDPDLIPTIRLVLPIFDNKNERFGMIAINTNYEKFLHNALEEININDEIYVLNNYSDYIRRDRDGKISKLRMLGGFASNAPTFIVDFLASGTGEGSFAVDNRLGYFHRVNISSADPDSFIGTIILAPKSRLLASANALLNQSLLIGGLLILIASLVAGMLGERFTKPIARMTASVRAFREGDTGPLDLPVNLNDEVGETARAFGELLKKLDAHRTKLSVQLEAFIANSVDGFVVIDDRGVIEQANPALLELFGYPREELIGQNVAILMPDSTGRKHDGYLGAYRETGEKTYIGTIRDEEARRKDGAIFPIALSISEVRLSDRRILSAVIRDMTAAREAQRKIQSYTEELERSNQELDQFAYIASHDLKAPLRVIDNASRWLEEDLGDKLTGEDRENMTLLRNRVKRMEKLLDDLLEYSRIGRTIDDRYQEVVTGAKLIDDILILLAPPESMEVRVSDRFTSILVNRMPLQRVIHNLINNAIKHHDRESGAIALDVEEAGKWIRFIVRDDGPGIPAEFQEKIFEMFNTLKPRDQVEGSGMGLALVKKTVEYFGGRVTVKSGEGRGAEFSFTWPAREQLTNMSEEAA